MKKAILLLCSYLSIFFLHSQNVEWLKQFDGTNFVRSLSVTTDISGDVYVTGDFAGTIDFDPGPSVLNFTCAIGTGMFVCKFNSNGDLLWAKKMSGQITYVARGQAIKTDHLNNIYVSGFFQDTIDFDPDTSVYNLIGSTTNHDIFVMKLDPNGDFEWAKKMGGTSVDESTSLVVDPNGNVYTTGFYSGTVDFDPGIGVLNLSGLNRNVFISKLDNSGNFIWAKQIAGTGNETGNSIILDSLGNVYTTGSFGGNVDFDPSPSLSIITAAGYTDVFISKLDSTGTFVWAKNIGNPYADCVGNKITIDSFGYIVLAGSFEGEQDFDLGAGVFNLTSGNYGSLSDIFMLKMNLNGNFAWAAGIGGDYPETLFSITTDQDGNIFTSGQFLDTADADPGPGIHQLVPYGVFPSDDCFISKYDAWGNFVWAKTMIGPLNQGIWDITMNSSGNVYGCGFLTDSTYIEINDSVNVIQSNAVLGGFLLKIGPDTCENLTLVIDSASGITCSSTGYASCYGLHGTLPYHFAWNTTPIDTNNAINITTGGIYTVTLSDSTGCSSSRSVLISSVPNVTGFDLNAHVISANFRPGFYSNIILDAYNDGCIPASGQLILELDTILVYNTATPPPDIIMGDSLIWNFTSLTYDSLHITPHVNVYTPTYALIGDSVHLNLSILPSSGDVDTTNNFKYYTYPIVNSYDPNVKQVFPTGECDLNYITSNETLTYTVHFQNTGNAEAINIFILDTIDPNLDLNSIRVVAQSHPLIVEVISDSILKFRFDNILLPDSNSNEPQSHGYVVFEVNVDSNAASNSPIKNTAFIYFDYNSPIITNTTNNFLVDSIPVTITPIFQSGCDSVIVNGYSYHLSGNYAQYFTNYLGCDSILSLNLTILDSSYSIHTVASCYDYTMNGNTYNNSGTYYQYLTNNFGCDSIITLYLTISDSTENIITTSACGTFTINDNTYTNSGIYYQYLTSSFGCDSTLIIDLTINNIDISVLQSGYNLTAQQTSATYQWIDCNNSNQPISGETSQSFTATTNGDYAVIVTVNGCTDTSACQTIFGFGIEDENFSSGLSASPNPTHSIINVQSKLELKNARLIITDINGKTLLQKYQLNGTNFQFDLSELNSGMYFFHLYSEGKEGVIKVVKE